MALKMWCSPLLEEKVTTRLLANEGRREQVPCRVELALPTAPWAESYCLLCQKGPSPQMKSTLFIQVYGLTHTTVRRGPTEFSTLIPCFTLRNSNSNNNDYIHIIF